MEPTGDSGEPDTELIGRCLSASQAATAAFDELYARHAGGVFAFLRGMHRGDEHAALDALQETFFRFYKALDRFEEGRAVRPWLLRIARNVSLDLLKKRSHVGEKPHGSDTFRVVARETSSAPEVAAQREAAELMRDAIGRIPASERAVFLLKHDQELTYAEVAEALGCSLRTAKYRMKSALEHLGREAERLGVSP
ncbi:MAG: RNA polymerase sigma factor [Planctomycetes bacterium]|nr:RNA polymerase sigma factor [Planctomycetota bacterium]